MVMSGWFLWMNQLTKYFHQNISQKTYFFIYYTSLLLKFQYNSSKISTLHTKSIFYIYNIPMFRQSEGLQNEKTQTIITICKNAQCMGKLIIGYNLSYKRASLKTYLFIEFIVEKARKYVVKFTKFRVFRSLQNIVTIVTLLTSVAWTFNIFRSFQIWLWWKCGKFLFPIDTPFWTYSMRWLLSVGWPHVPVYPFSGSRFICRKAAPYALLMSCLRQKCYGVTNGNQPFVNLRSAH